MRSLLFALATLVALFASTPASASDFDPRMIGMMMKPMMHAMHQQQHRRRCDPRYQRCPQMHRVQPRQMHHVQQQMRPCGSGYVAPGVIAVDRGDCNMRYGRQRGYDGRQYWGPSQGQYQHGGFARRTTARSTRVHVEQHRRVTVQGSNNPNTSVQRDAPPPSGWAITGR